MHKEEIHEDLVFTNTASWVGFVAYLLLIGLLFCVFL